MKVLVLTCSTGGGHNACANYIKNEFNDNNIECDVKNYMDIAGKNASSIAESLYLGSTKGKGNIFKGVYKIGELYSKTKIPSPVYGLNKLVKDKLYKYITENNYDIIIGTHLFPCLTLTAIKKEHEVKFINVATDYECIPFWEETNPDAFVIPSSFLKNRFIEKGIKEDILLPTGIPVASKFLKIKNDIDIPKDKDIVLITSGSMGFGSVEKLVTMLLEEIDNCYFLVICGNNLEMKNKLLNINNPNLIVKGFVNNMNEYMHVATIIITKPGGLTTSEVVTMNKPLIHMMPIPGVENYNANFFESNKMSLKANNIDEVVAAAKKLLIDKELQQEMINNQQKIINKNSAKDLVDYVIKTFNNERT